MAKVTIEFAADNAVFEEQYTEDVGRIMRELAVRLCLQLARKNYSYPVRDSNGNTVGKVTVE